MNKKTIVFSIIFVLLLVVISILFLSKSSFFTNKFVKNQKRILCKQKIEDKLVSPREAEYGNLKLYVSSVDWAIDGWVDSQNQLGVYIRQKFICYANSKGDPTVGIGEGTDIYSLAEISYSRLKKNGGEGIKP